MQNAKKVKYSLLYLSGKKQFYHMNDGRVLTVKSAASGDRVQLSFLSDRSLSKHSSEFFSLIYL